MVKLRFAAVAVAVGVLVGPGTGAFAAAGGDPNAGDVWLDNVGQPPGPGHEMDPHLACQDINLWGDKLADSSGSYTISGWPPSGSKKVDYSDTWSYSQSQGGDQIISVINVQQLIAAAAANGETPAHNGYHFKLDLSQDPQKHKTFWVNCPAPSSSSTAGTTTTAATTTATTTTATTTTAPTRVGVTRSSVHRRHVRRHKRHARRHRHRVLARRISRAPRVSSGFTG